MTIGTEKQQWSDPEAGFGAEDVAVQIRRILVQECLQPGDRIGSERQLADRFAVSRWTIRQALDHLQADGLILRTNGRNGGVFVAPGKVMRDVSEFVSLPHYLHAQGVKADTTVISTQMLRADESLSEKLEVSVGTWVYEIDRLRLGSELPLCAETVWYSAEMFPGLLNESLVGSLSDLISGRYGVDRGESIESVTSFGASKKHSASLHVLQGAPLLVVDRVSRTAAGEVFEASRECFRADRIALVVHTQGGARPKRRLR